jgi:guanylate kinase
VEILFDLERPAQPTLRQDLASDPRLCEASSFVESPALADWLERQLHVPALVFVVGAPQSGRRKYARSFANRTGAVHVNVNGNATLNVEMPSAEVIAQILSEFHLKRPHCIVVSGFPRNVADAIAVDGRLHRHWRQSLETVCIDSASEVLLQRLSKLGVQFSSALDVVNEHISNFGPLEKYSDACSDSLTRLDSKFVYEGTPLPSPVHLPVIDRAKTTDMSRAKPQQVVFILDPAANGQATQIWPLNSEASSAHVDLRTLLNTAQQSQTLEGQILRIAPLVGSTLPCVLLIQLLQEEINRATADVIFVEGFPLDEDQARAAVTFCGGAATMLLIDTANGSAFGSSALGVTLPVSEYSQRISGALRVFLEEGKLFRLSTDGAAVEVSTALDQQLSAMQFRIPFPLLAVAGPDHGGKREVLEPLQRNGRVILVESITTSERAVTASSEPMHLVSEDVFEGMIRDRELVEFQRVHGVYFGTPLAAVQRASRSGKLPLVMVNHHRSRMIRESGIPCVLLALAPLSLAEFDAIVSQMSVRPLIRNELQRVARDELRQIGDHASVYDCVVLHTGISDAAEHVNTLLDQHPLVCNAEVCKRYALLCA